MIGYRHPLVEKDRIVENTNVDFITDFFNI